MSAIVACITPANAGVIFSNFGPGQSFANVGLGVGNLSPAEQFIAPSDSLVSQIDVALTNNGAILSGQENPVTVSLLTDIGGAPGVLLGQWQTANVTPDLAVYTISGISGVSVSDGTEWQNTLSISPRGQDSGSDLGIQRFRAPHP